MKIIKRSTCKPISPSSKPELTYEIGHVPSDKIFKLRITGNTGGGQFSHEWIAVNDALSCIQAVPDGETFKATLFKPLYVSRGASNAGFFAAALRNEGLLVLPEKSVYGRG